MTHSHIQQDGQHYLAPDPVMEKPEYKDYFHEPFHFSQAIADYGEYLTSCILIPPEHVKDFEGRTGLVEGKDFETQTIFLIDNEWKDCGNISDTSQTRLGAIPIKPVEEQPGSRKQAIIDLMHADEEAGLYDEPINSYEVFTEKFTKIVQAISVEQALSLFRKEHADKIIQITDVAYQEGLSKVSEQPEDKGREEISEVVRFAAWYSGMEVSKVKRAYARWLSENDVAQMRMNENGD